MKYLMYLAVLPALLIHCNGSDSKNTNGDADDPKNPANNIEQMPISTPKNVVSCIAGVYSGKGDIRWNSLPGSMFGFDIDAFNQDLNVSIVFAGNNLLIRAEGDDGDVLCTLYEGVVEKAGVLSATTITNSRTQGNATFSDSLAYSFTDIQIITAVETHCSFNIGSSFLTKATNTTAAQLKNEKDTIKSTNLIKNTNQADYSTILTKCESESPFSTFKAPKKQEAEEKTKQ